MKKPIKLTYEFDDGSVEYVEGDQLEAYERNVEKADVFGLRQIDFYEPVEWKEQK